jgi:hypothetical protein
MRFKKPKLLLAKFSSSFLIMKVSELRKTDAGKSALKPLRAKLLR